MAQKEWQLADMGTKSYKNSGFSLLEILIVLGFLSGLISLGVINIRSYMQELRLNQATTAFVGSLNQMSDDALRFSQRISLGEYGLSSGEIIWTNSDGEFGRLELPNGAIVSQVHKSIPNQAIWFTGRGLPFQQVSFAIALNNNIRRVVLLPTGVILRQ